MDRKCNDRRTHMTGIKRLPAVKIIFIKKSKTMRKN